jgi:hypothetical protein
MEKLPEAAFGGLSSFGYGIHRIVKGIPLCYLYRRWLISGVPEALGGSLRTTMER